MTLKEIQQQLKVPKSQFNAFGKYNYRNCEDILEAVKPLLGESVLTLTDEIVNIGDRYYVKATAKFLSEKEIVDITAYAREALDKKGMDESQITGAASSYARKYALCGLFLIDDGKDADSDDNTKNAPVASQKVAGATKPGTLTGKQKENIVRLLKRLGVIVDETAPDKIKALTGLELIPEAYGDICDRLENLIAEKESDQ